MNRSELVAAVAAQVGSDQAQARRHVDAVFETIMNSVVEGERVVVTGFGTFERVTRPARTVRNPRTGRPMQVASSQAPRFSVGRTFKENVSGGLAASAQVASPVSAEVSGDVAEAAAVAANGNVAANGKKKKKKKDVDERPSGAKKAKAANPAKAAKIKSAKKAARKGK